MSKTQLTIRNQCIPHTPVQPPIPADTMTDDIAEELRQLRAALSVYRSIVERLMAQNNLGGQHGTC